MSIQGLSSLVLVPGWLSGCRAGGHRPPDSDSAAAAATCSLQTGGGSEKGMDSRHVARLRELCGPLGPVRDVDVGSAWLPPALLSLGRVSQSGGDRRMLGRRHK